MFKKIIAVIFVSVYLIVVPVTAYDIPVNQNYIYNTSRKPVPIPDAYNFIYSIKLAEESGLELEKLTDMCLVNDGSIFVLDGVKGRILKIDSEYKVSKVIDRFVSVDGSQTTLAEPEGIHVTSNGLIYIADTGNNRVVVVDESGTVKLEIRKPLNMPGVSESTMFLPSKIDIDDMGRIYVVARNINMGIMCLDGSGNFLNFIGAPRVVPSLSDLFWLRFSTKEQKSQMTQYVSTEYNNVFVDELNFVWGTIGNLEVDKVLAAIQSADNSGRITPVSKINSMDRDVLKRNGFYPPLGDLMFTGKPSVIIDVALNRAGIYSLLDFERGRVFTYDNNGNLLFVFGSKGDKKENFLTPTAIGYYEDKVYVLDSELCEIKIFEPTGYGQLVISAVNNQFNGNYDMANEQWAELAKMNSNFEYAFIGLGEVSSSEGKYKTAMNYFKYAKDTRKYSEVFALYRQTILEKVFPVLFASTAILIVIMILKSIYIRINKYLNS